MLDLHQLQSFVAVVETRSFTAAAASLHLSKAAVSLHVKHLEAEVGGTLLTRTTRQVRATEAGERLYRSALRLLAEAEHATAEARDAQAGLGGTLRITSLAEYLAVVLVPAVAAFGARHPRLRLELSGSAGPSDLVRERFDLAVRLGVLPDSTLQATRIGQFRLHAVATPELVAARGLPLVPADLEALPWVLFEPAATQRSRPLCFVWSDGAGSTARSDLRPAIRSDSSATLLAFVRAHAGASLLPDWLVRDDVAAGRLVRLIPGYELPAQGIFAVRPRGGPTPTKVRRFIDHLHDSLRNEPV